jgi:hypothetical protein
LLKNFLIHAGVLGLISLVLIVVGNFLGEYWMRKRRLGKFRRIHGYILLVAYVVTVVHVGEGLTAYVDLLGAFSGLSLALHLAHIFLAINFSGLLHQSFGGWLSGSYEVQRRQNRFTFKRDNNHSRVYP